MSEDVKSLPLESYHKELGAKFAPFAGWNMPVRYSSIADEHAAVRKGAGVFDVSHMGQIFVSGAQSEAFIEKVYTNTVNSLCDGQARYGFFLNPVGGVIDDVIVYRLAPKDYFLCVNAANIDTVFQHLSRELENFDGSEHVVIDNASERYVQFALQGPQAKSFAVDSIDEKLEDLKFFRITELSQFSHEEDRCLISTTGYTGEFGYEIFVPLSTAEKVWKILAQGESDGLLSYCGLAARDTLRLEAALPLHGHELGDDITPLNAGLSRFVDFEKPFFIGKSALEQQKSLGVNPCMVGIEVHGPGVVRDGASVLSKGATIGWVSSGTKIPGSAHAIAIAFVMPEFTEEGTELSTEVRGRELPLKVVRLPFYKRK